MPALRYAGQHQQLRALLLRQLIPGTPCPQVVDGHLCGQPMYRDQALELGHTPEGSYLGLVHRTCNRADGAIRRTRVCIRCKKQFQPSRKRQRHCEQCVMPKIITTARPW